ncbi:MAG: DUF4292 domain-containing protein [Deltaproteobacteria bacterium]|nr:DUF4292 domain-containing protein [Deltaproteobacteria bacterium]
MRALLAGALLSTLLLTSACPRRFDFGPNPADDAGELLAASRERLASPATLQGEAKLRFQLPQGRFGADHLVALAVPDRLRLDTLSFFGSPLAVLMVREGELLLWDIEGGRAYRGSATTELLATLLPVVLDPGEVVDLLLGRPPLELGAKLSLRLDHEARAYRVEVKGAAGVQRVWIDPELGTIRRYRHEPAAEGEDAWEVSYEDYRPVAGEGSGLLPWTIRYERAGTGLDWRWRSLEVDSADFDPAIFELALPPGIPTVPLGPDPAILLPPEVNE